MEETSAAVMNSASHLPFTNERQNSSLKIRAQMKHGGVTQVSRSGRSYKVGELI